MSILQGLHRVQYGTRTIEFELMHSERRTLACHVYPDGSVVVDAPLNTPLVDVETRVRKRAAWILRQQRQFERYPEPQPLPHRYVSGESFRYLGRQYRLKVDENSVERVVLTRGWLTVSVHDREAKERIGSLIDAWYRKRAQIVFDDQLKKCAPRVEVFGVHVPELVIRAMKTRWGSCSAYGRITLNPKLVQAPRYLIDYVILHELCHLLQPNHSRAFYELLDRVLPDWAERKQKLNELEIR